mgnify:CR=1 FL=1
MRTFLEVTTTGSFLLSAEKLHVTQSTISARIKSLENQLQDESEKLAKQGFQVK